VVALTVAQLPDLVAAGMLAPLPTALLDDDFYPHLRAAVTVDGSPYCLPHTFHTLALFYNKTYFNAAELAYPDATWQWGDLQQAAATLTSVEDKRYGLVLAADFSRWLAFLTQAGGAVTDNNARAMAIDSPEAAAALDFYVNLVLEGMAAVPSALDGRWPGEAFAGGRAALAVEGNWLAPYLATNAADLVYGIAPLPTGPAGAATVSFATCYAIPQGAAEQSAAQLLLTDLTAPEQLAAWLDVDNALPARRSLQAAWRAAHPDQAAFADQIAVAQEWRLPAGFQPWLADRNDELRRIFGGFIPTTGVLTQAATAGAELLNAQSSADR
jgi:multiple sugar transport system substrate-binding protein